MSREMNRRRPGAHAAVGPGFVILGLAILAPAMPVRAETPPGVSSPAKNTDTAPPPAASSDPFCAAQGGGFVRLEGTQTCLKLGGYVQIDSTTQNGPAAGLPAARAPALQSR